MAWRDLEITRICGHRERHKIIKNDLQSVDAEAERLATGKCKTCWTADERAAEEVRNESMAEKADLPLPPLEGTDAQIAFAASKRGQILRAIVIGDFVTGHVEGGREAAAKIAPVTASWWWIETAKPNVKAMIEALIERCRTLDVDRETRMRPTRPGGHERR